MAETSTLTITRPPSSIIKNAPALRARDQAIRDGAPKTKELRDWILKFRALKTPASLSSRRTVSWIRPRLEEAKNDSGHLSEPNKPHPPTVPTITTINDTAVKDGIDLQKTHNSQDSGVHVNDDTRASSHSTGTTGASTRASSSSACEQSVPETARALDPLLEVAEAQPPSTSSKAKGKEVFAGIRSAGDVDSNIPVSVPMTRLQRLATLNLVSQKDLIARPIPVGNAEISKLRAFSAFLSPIKDQITLFGKELPRCRHHLVDFEPQHESSGASKAYICIEGLTNTADIKLFHKVMSQTRYRYLYEPWGLCYEAMKISRLAADHHVLQLQGNGDTYCGAVLEPSTGSEKFSTIGGLVEVDGNIYAMTTSHLPDKYQPVVEEKLKSLLENQADNLAESDFPENVEPAWVLTFDQDDYSAFSEISTETREGFFLDRAPEEISEYRERSFPNNRSLAVIEGDDWKLMPMDHRRQLPNIFFPSHGDKKYIINVCESPSGCAVAVVAGVTRPQSGTMSLGPSFLVGDGIVQEIWTTYMSKSGPGNSCPT
ncbi:hypothetical protein B0T24DRAFT_607185 [Lasiosphaeria ovina]|uniref:Uncharacterized protein n=1 Tax=Lasiosphaeria ovina TaxID=92902 RepID=A0AAE0TY95_9PEZI|nr:hypothetical protein B0T24DRAFT_607185 [Lasiosphaeria ovina]